MQYTYQDNTITFFEPISDNVLNLLPRLETTQVGKLQFNLPSFFSESLFELYINNLNDKKRILTYEDIIMLPHKYFDRYNEPEKLVEVVIKRYKRASESEKNEVLSDSTYKAEFLLKSTESEQYPTIRTTYVSDLVTIIEKSNPNFRFLKAEYGERNEKTYS